MKVKCIREEKYLTIGKLYKVIENESNKYVYKIINDYSNESYHPKTYFKILSEIRNDKINKLLK